MTHPTSSHSFAAMRRPGAAPRFMLSTLTLALGLALVGAPDAARAQAAAVSVDIAAQPLGDALMQWAAQTKVRVFYAPDVVAGLSSRGLRGSLPPEEALRSLLQGTGVAYRWQGDSIILSRDGGVTSLAPVTVTGSSDPAITEGTGSYTTPATAAATGLTLSLRETPQ
ncbi:MAG TPA: TonB-dependent siderophore receptor, partial [Achromobacter sp.]|nr:TonB-dependent siderophore receptor [Achromobacter sp.]